MHDCGSALSRPSDSGVRAPRRLQRSAATADLASPKVHHSNYGPLAPGHWSQVQALLGTLEGRLHRAEGPLRFSSVLHAASWSSLREILQPCARAPYSLQRSFLSPPSTSFCSRASPTSCAVQSRHLSTHHHSTRASAQRRAELRSNHEAPSVPPPVGRRTV